MMHPVIDYSESRNVYLCKMTFLIPLPRIRREYARKVSLPLRFATPFVHHLNAEFHYAPINDGGAFLNALPTDFWFASKYNGRDTVQRQVAFTPYLLKFSIGKDKEINYAVILVGVVNSHFVKGNDVIGETDWCTPNDLVNLARAMTETGENGLFTRSHQREISMSDWLDSMLKEVSNVGICSIKSSDIFSVTNISVQRLNSSRLSPAEVIESFRHGYYEDNYYRSIDDYQNSMLYDGCNTDTDVTADYFIHGLLYKNDNFLHLHPHNALEIKNNFYTNNRVEKYWADYGSIVSIKVGTPFSDIAENDKITQDYDNSLTETDCLMELCLLSKLSALLVGFKRDNLKMKSHEIEKTKAKIAEYFCDKLFDVRELDKRLSFFISRFGLDLSKTQINEIAQPRRSERDVYFTRFNAFAAALLSLITIIIAFITLLVTYASH